MNKPSPKQREALNFLADKETNFVGYGGGAFGGKSYLLCKWLTHVCLKYPETGWGFGRKELVTLKKTTLVTLFKVFKEMNITNSDYTYNGQLNIIKFFNGSEIFLIDTAYQPSDPLYTRFGGLELTGCVIDQSEESPIEAINILFTRLGRRKNLEYGIAKKMLETFNPAKNHVYYRYFKPSKEGTLRPTYKFVQALPQDNPSPEVEDYVKGILENSDQQTIERLIYGNFEYDDDPNILMNYDAVINSFSNSYIKQTGKKYITTDIALSSDLFVAFAWDGWTIIDVLILHKTDAKIVEQKLKEFALRHRVPASHISYDADGIGAYLKGFMVNSYSFYNGGKPIELRLKKMNYKNLKAQCFHYLADKMNLNEIFISEHVANQKINNIFVRDKIIEESQVIKRDRVDVDGSFTLIPKDQMKAILGHSPDFMDAMMQRSVFDLKPVSFSSPKATVISMR